MKRLFGLLIVAAVLVGGCGEDRPARDQIPLLRDKIYRLQEAVKDRNTATVDSLLSVKIIDRGQSSDSLVSFVYGPADDFAFERFGDYDIAYTKDRARIECFVMDSTAQKNRPLTIFMALEHDMWLVTSFEVPDSLAADSAQ